MMCSRSIFGLAVIITISILTLPFSAHAQFVSNLPDCVQNCIYSSQDDDCEITDIVCLCRASAGDFLPDLITCMHDSCDSELDDDLLLEPLKLACEIAGAPIPSAALQSAENEATSLATQVTKTETVTQPVTTTTVYPNSGSSSVETVTVTTTAAGGSTVYVAYPVTVWSKTTVTGSLSTVTIISTDTYILSATASPSTTNSASDAASTSDSRTTTSVEAEKTTKSVKSTSKTTTSIKPGITNSSPFSSQSGSARLAMGSWLGFGVLLCCGLGGEFAMFQ